MPNWLIPSLFSLMLENELGTGQGAARTPPSKSARRYATINRVIPKVVARDVPGAALAPSSPSFANPRWRRTCRDQHHRPRRRRPKPGKRVRRSVPEVTAGNAARMPRTRRTRSVTARISLAVLAIPAWNEQREEEVRVLVQNNIGEEVLRICMRFLKVDYGAYAWCSS